MTFTLKDSGARKEGPGGMLKEDAGKPQPTLIPTWFIWRLAAHMSKGALKYARDNWMKGCSEQEYLDFKDAAYRHFLLWQEGMTDEDHMAAVCFNMWAAEHVKEQAYLAEDPPVTV